MALCLRAFACSLLCALSGDAFRSVPNTDPVPTSVCGIEVAEKTPLGGGLDEPPFKEEELTKYLNRSRVPAQGCPQPKPLGLQEGELGEVDYLYTFGAPGLGSPRFMHATNEDGVFPGVRTWRTSGDWNDIVPMVCRVVSSWHPRMNSEEIACNEQPIAHDPTDQVSRWPYSIWASLPLHKRIGYYNVTKQRINYYDVTEQRSCDLWNLYTHFSVSVSYEEPAYAIEHVASLGWRVAGFGFYVGGWIGGSQHSYLLQHPETLECVVTIQGTRDRYDWAANLAVTAEHFCGYAEEDESCGSKVGDCSTRQERGAFVHNGFAAHLRNMVQTESWQQGVHAKLSKCSAVYATGHSLGGAAAGLFAGCVSRKLKPDDFGYEDYKWMAWTKGKPELLPTAHHQDGGHS